MSNISKILSLIDIPQLNDSDEEVLNIWLELWTTSVSQSFQDLHDFACMQMPKEIFSKVVETRYKWIYGDFLLEDDLSNSNIIPNLLDRIQKVADNLQSQIIDGREISLDDFWRLWEVEAKEMVFYLSKLSPKIAHIIRQPLAPYYLRPLIERYEREWHEIKTEEKRIANTYTESDNTLSSQIFSLPEDFFTQNANRTSDHLCLRKEITTHGIEAFQNLLTALVEYGYIDCFSLPLLAYRLTGFGNPYDEKQMIIWLKEPRVIRYLISIFQDPGANYPSMLDGFFVDEDGKNFIKTISAGEARNIKKLKIFKEVIRPLYGGVIKLP